MKRGKDITYEMCGVVYNRTLDINDIRVARERNLPIYEVRSFGKTLELSPRIPTIRNVINKHLSTDKKGVKLLSNDTHIHIYKLVGDMKHRMNLVKFMRGHVA
jgi:hypothetical protein